MVALGYNAPYHDEQTGTTVNFANVMVAGGEGFNGARTNKVVDSYAAIIGGGVSFGDDSASFPNLPEARSGGILEVDSTAPFSNDITTSYANASIYVFGGELDTGFTNTMLVARSVPPSVQLTTWQTVTPIGPHVPDPRADFAGVEISGKLYIFGGQDNETVFGDMWTFDFATQNWTRINNFGDVPKENVSDAWATSNAGKPFPLLPPARYGHSMVRMVGTNNFGALTELLILAGGTNGHTYFNDLWAFDPISKNWESLTMPSPTYSPRAFQGLMAHHNESYVFIYGGEFKETPSSNATYYDDIWTIDMSVPLPKGPGFKALPNNIIAGVAGGILLVLIITVIVLKVTDRNSN
jgi:hypothetical protein